MALAERQHMKSETPFILPSSCICRIYSKQPFPSMTKSSSRETTEVGLSPLWAFQGIWLITVWNSMLADLSGPFMSFTRGLLVFLFLDFSMREEQQESSIYMDINPP